MLTTLTALVRMYDNDAANGQLFRNRIREGLPAIRSERWVNTTAFDHELAGPA